MALWFALVAFEPVRVVALCELALVVARLPVALVFEAAASLMPKSWGTMLLACELAFELTGLVKAPPPVALCEFAPAGAAKACESNAVAQNTPNVKVMINFFILYPFLVKYFVKPLTKSFSI